MKRNNPQATIDREEAIKRLPRSIQRMFKRFRRTRRRDLNFPPDFIENLDHYLYGTPKQK